jgi:signal transduction histidine kinase
MDLLSSSNRFSEIEIFVENKFPITDGDLQARFGFVPKRAAFFDIVWRPGIVYIMRKEELSQARTLTDNNPGIFLLSFDEIPREFRHSVFPLVDNSTDTIAVLEFIEGIVKEKTKLSLKEEAQRSCTKLFKDASSYLSKKEDAKSELADGILSAFFSFDSELLQIANLEEFITKCSDLFKGVSLWSDMALADIDELLELRQDNPNLKIFPLDWLGLPQYLVYRPEFNNEKAVSFGVSLLLEWLEKYAAFNPQLTKALDQSSLWEEAVTEIPMPLSVINTRGDLIVYNNRFTRLNLPPRDCLNLNEDDTLEINGDFFRVIKMEMDRDDGDAFLFLFLNQDRFNSDEGSSQGLKSISSQELGIISSSIAHELNNPLAGILAAIGLLELEDWESDSSDVLKDMKESAMRCKTLVEIFLGFSRAKDQHQKVGSMREALGQALDLLRFRMVEADVRIEVDVESGSVPFKRYMNLSLSSMVLYLVLGEILTYFNHHRLVLGDESLKTLKTVYKEENDRVLFTFSSEIDLSEKFLSSKLVKYLVEVQGLEMEIDHNKIILTDWKLI